jgi:predicted dehydrogenase
VALINRILIVGYGSIGKRHLRIARELLPDADIRILRREEMDLIPEGANGCFSNIEQAISFEPQLSVLANPAVFHVSVASQLAEIGSHLLMEKPISVDAKGVQDLIELCNQKNRVLLIGYNMRFLPSLKKFRELLHSNIVGSVLSARMEVGQYLPSWRSGMDYRDGVSGNRALGGGVLLELSHELDYASWIFGRVDWINATLRKQSSLEIDVEDTAHLILGFVAEKNHSNQLVATINLDFIRHDTARSCVAIGQNGTLRLDFMSGTIELLRAGELQWSLLFSSSPQNEDSYLAEWKHMLKCIKNQEQPLVTGLEALRVIQVIAAARYSSASGGEVKINYSLN